MLVHELTPVPDVAVALAAVGDLPGIVLFDSALTSDELGRWSFLSADPFRWFELPTDAVAVQPFEELRLAMREFTVERSADMPPFVGGCAGILSYELGRCFERLPTPRENAFQFPFLAVGIYDWVLAWDRQEDRCWLLSHGFPETGVAQTRRASERISDITQRLRQPPPAAGVKRSPSALEHTGRHPLPFMNGLLSNFTRDEYLQAVERAIEYIAAGDIFQANLSQRLFYPSQESPISLYRRLRACNPAPFAGCLIHDDWAVLERIARAVSQTEWPCRRDASDQRDASTSPSLGTRSVNP